MCETMMVMDFQKTSQHKYAAESKYAETSRASAFAHSFVLARFFTPPLKRWFAPCPDKKWEEEKRDERRKKNIHHKNAEL